MSSISASTSENCFRISDLSYTANTASKTRPGLFFLSQSCVRARRVCRARDAKGNAAWVRTYVARTSAANRNSMYRARSPLLLWLWSWDLSRFESDLLRRIRERSMFFVTQHTVCQRGKYTYLAHVHTHIATKISNSKERVKKGSSVLSRSQSHVPNPT